MKELVKRLLRTFTVEEEGWRTCSESGKPQPSALVNLKLGAQIRSVGLTLNIWGLKGMA